MNAHNITNSQAGSAGAIVNKNDASSAEMVETNIDPFYHFLRVDRETGTTSLRDADRWGQI